MTKTLRTMDLLYGEIDAMNKGEVIAYLPDGTTKTISFRKWDELFEQADAWGAVRVHIPGNGWLVKFQGEWYCL